MNPLEDRLRQALAAAAEEVPASRDAWVQNQQRLAERSGAVQRRRFSRYTAGALGAAAAVAAGVFALPTLTAPPRQVHDGPGETQSTMVGGALDARGARVDLRLEQVSGEAALCYDQRVREGKGNGGCIAGQPDAKDPSVAFDFWTEYRDGKLRTVVGAVDQRATRVTVTGDDDRARRVRLVDLGDGLSGFAVTTRSDSRLVFVAFDDANRTIDITETTLPAAP